MSIFQFFESVKVVFLKMMFTKYLGSIVTLTQSLQINSLSNSQVRMNSNAQTLQVAFILR